MSCAPRLTSRIRSLTTARMFSVILLAGFIARAGFVLLLEPYRDRERYELERVAISLVENGVLGNPYSIPTGPSAHIAPLYAFLMAGIFWLFGTGLAGEVVKVLVSTLLSVVPYALFPKLAASLGLGRELGFGAGLLAGLVPLKPGSDLLGDWEAPAAAAFLVLCMIGVADVWRQRKLALWNAVRQGFIWGVALLTAPAFLTIYIGTVFVGLLLSLRTSWRPHFRFAVVQTAVVAWLLLPWVVRNQIELGAPIATRSNMGLELRLSNNPAAGPSENRNFRAGLYHRYHPLQNVREAEKLRVLGEVSYNNQAQAEALAWIRSEPGRFMSLSLQRAKLFWFPISDPVRAVLFGCLSVASFAGTVILLRREAAAGLVLAVPMLIQPLPHYLVHVNVRHKYPIDWIGVLGVAIILQAACALFFAKAPLRSSAHNRWMKK